MSRKLFDQDLDRREFPRAPRAAAEAAWLRRLWWHSRPAWLGCGVCGGHATRRDRYGWTCDHHSDPVRFGV